MTKAEDRLALNLESGDLLRTPDEAVKGFWFAPASMLRNCWLTRQGDKDYRVWLDFKNGCLVNAKFLLKTEASPFLEYCQKILARYSKTFRHPVRCRLASRPRPKPGRSAKFVLLRMEELTKGKK